MWKNCRAAWPLYLVLLLMIAVNFTVSPKRAMAGAVQAHQDGMTEWLLSIVLNEQDLQEVAVLVRAADGRLLADPETLRRWRLRVPTIPGLSYQGRPYYPLDALPSLSYTLDERTMVLSIDSPPELFDPTLIAARTSRSAKPTPSTPGAFINYDAFGRYLNGQIHLDGSLELGLFNHFGVGTSGFLGRDLQDNPRLIRLDTTWTTDFPAKLTSLRLGDAVTRPGAGGRAVRFGGVQWGTNFAIQPGFIPFPTPVVRGEATLPSTVDLYIENALMLRRDIPPGPFEIVDFPVLTGQGEIHVVTRDLLGRQQIVTQPYYVSASLLRPGLHDYTYQLGSVREDFGLESNRYGRAFAAATHRYGFSDRFTGEVHGEALRSQQTLGITGIFLWPAIGTLSGSLAASRSEIGSGILVSVGLEQQTGSLNYRLATEWTSDDFTQLGLSPGQPAPRQRSQALIAFRHAMTGSIGLGYIHQEHRDRSDIGLLTLNYSRSLGKHWLMNLSAIQDLRGDDPSVFVTLTRPWGERSSINAGLTAQRDTQQLITKWQQNLPPGSGIGYQASAVGGDFARMEAGLSLQTDIGTYRLDIARSSDETALQGNISGGLAVLDGRAFPARRIDDSFGVVAVPGYGDVRVYADNQLIARTNAAGYALLPRLRPYERNPIRIEVADLPLDAQIEALERDAVPYLRSGLLLPFAVRQSRGALFRILLEDGQPLPAGAVVHFIEEEEKFPVALDGEVYVTGLGPQNRLRAVWRGQSCEFAVLFPDGTDPLPHLGDFICKGVLP